MLTDIDVHYLVGLLTRLQEADDVVIELGDMVLDKASGKKRDVDITAIYTDEGGERSAYKGIEVKNHTTRPLNVEHVEQLCLKLTDMPDITHKAIVSASGYTDGAINKAKAHKVELLEVVDWADPGEGFNVKFTLDAFTIIEPIWTTGPHVVINVAKENYGKVGAVIKGNPKVCHPNGKPIPNMPDVESLSSHAHKTISDKIVKQSDQTKVQNGDTTTVNKIVQYGDNPCIKVGNELIPVTNCEVSGVITYKVHDKRVFKVLRKQGSQKPIAGCVIVETGNQSLMGISVNNVDNKITALNIPYADRLRKKIRGYRLSVSQAK